MDRNKMEGTKWREIEKWDERRKEEISIEKKVKKKEMRERANDRRRHQEAKPKKEKSRGTNRKGE